MAEIIIVNKTPHAVNIVDDEGQVIKTFEPDATSIRLSMETKRVATIDGIPFSRTVYGGGCWPS